MTKFGEAGMEKITPRMFGAKQDGVTDDFEALAKSILRALGGESERTGVLTTHAAKEK